MQCFCDETLQSFRFKRIENELSLLNEEKKNLFNDYKDEFVLIILSAPIIVLAYAVFSDDPDMMQKIELFFHHFGNLPVWFQTLWITVVASIFGIKGTQIFKNGGGPKKK